VALFSRKDSSTPVVTAVVSDSSSVDAKNATPKKGRATPKRADAQAARRKPIVASTAPNRPLTKEEKEQRRAKDRARRDEAYEGMKAGVEKHLPSRDKGAQRRYVRQYVDARRNLAEYFIPATLVFLFLTFFAQNLGVPLLALIMMALFYVLIAIAGVDAYLMWRKLKSQLITKFGSVEKGTAYYATMRALQLRRMRMPVPMVNRGNFPS